MLCKDVKTEEEKEREVQEVVSKRTELFNIKLQNILRITVKNQCVNIGVINDKNIINVELLNGNPNVNVNLNTRSNTASKAAQNDLRHGKIDWNVSKSDGKFLWDVGNDYDYDCYGFLMDRYACWIT